MEGAIKGVYCSLPRIIATPIQYSFIAYFWEMFVTEFGWTFSEYSKLYWIYTFTQVISYTALGYLLYEIVNGLDEDRKLKYSKWIEIGSIILLSVRTIIWNLLCRARTTARNYLTPYETYPFEKAERDKRIRIIRSMFPDLLDQRPNAKSRFILQSTLGQDPELAVNSLPRLSVIDWSKVFRHLSLPFKIIWNLLCRARTTARNYLTPYESYPFENAERQKRLRIIRSMFPELANPLPQPEPNIESYSDPIVNTLPKQSLLSRMRSLFKPKSKLRSPYDFPFSPVEFGGVPDLTATWTMVWYKRKDPLVPEIEYKPSLRERLNYFGNRGSYNVAKYDPPVPEMYIPPKPEPSPMPSTSKFTPTSPPPIPPIKRDPKHEPIEQLLEPKSMPKPNQGPIPYITPGPPPVDSIPEPITESEVDSIFDPEPVPMSSPIRTPSHNIPRLNNRPANSFSRRLKSFFCILVSKRSILYTMTILHGLGMSSFDLCNKALSTYIYKEHIVDDPDGNKYDQNDTLRNTLNTISVGFFAGASFFIILLFSFVKNFAHSKTAFSNTFFIISILFFFGQIPVLYFFHKRAEGNSNADNSIGNHQCLELRTDDYLKLISFIIFHATTTFWIFTAGLLIDYVSISTIDDNLSIIAFVISIIILGFPVISWLHIGVVTLIRNTCGFLFDCGDSQLIIIAACIIGQGTIHYLFNPHNYWWNISGTIQFFILIIIGIANTILLIYTYVMFDNTLKKKTVNNWKWLVIGGFYSIVSLVVYSAIYICFSAYYTNELIESTCNLPSWIYRYEFPTIYKFITFIFQLANVATYAVYYLLYTCDLRQKRLEEEANLKQQLNEEKRQAAQARDEAKKSQEAAEQARHEARQARDEAQKAQSSAREEAGRVRREAQTAKDYTEKVAKEAQIVSAYALEVAVYALNVAAWAKISSAGALDIVSSAKNVAGYALNFATNAMELASYAHRDASYAKIVAEDAKKDGSIAKAQAAVAQRDSEYTKAVARYTRNLAVNAEVYASSAKNFAEDALNYASTAKKDASTAKKIANEAKAVALWAHDDAEWAKYTAEEAKGVATYTKSTAIHIKDIAEQARERADAAATISQQAKKIANEAKATAIETEKIAKLADGRAKDAKATADVVKRALETTKKMAETISKVERGKIQSLAQGLATAANQFTKKAVTFKNKANDILATPGNDQEVQNVLTQFSTAADAFGIAADKLGNEQNGAANMFQEFTKALRDNTTCNIPNLSISPILFGLVNRIEKFQEAVKDFKDKADIFGDSRKSNSQLSQQFQTMATKFSRTGKAFSSFAQALKNAAEYFEAFATALQNNTGCNGLKSKAQAFKSAAEGFAIDARTFETAAFSFCGQSSQITNKTDLDKLKKHFNTSPTGTQLPQKFKDAADILSEAIKNVVV